MNLKEYILSLNPAVCWPMDETAGGTAEDATANNRDGTYTGGPTKNQASMVPNMPSSPSVGFDGVDDRVERATEAWMNPGANFTAIYVYMPRSFAAQRDVMGRRDSWQIWQETSGKLQAHITPAWTSFLSTSILTINTAYLIGIRQNSVTGKASIWINGVKDAEVNKATALSNGTTLLAATSSAPAPGRPVNSRGQFFAYWPGVALTDAEMLELYTRFSDPPSIPTDPDDVTLDAAGPGLAVATWTASTDADLEDMVYYLEYWDGDSWEVLTNTPDLDYEWSVPAALRGRDDVKIRVRALDEEGAYSAWVESNEVTIPDLAPSEPDVDFGATEAIISWGGGGLDVEGEYWDGLLWRPLFAAQPEESFTWDVSKRKGTAKVRIRTIDSEDVPSAWVESDEFVLPGMVFGNIWRALQSYDSLEMLWKLNEVSVGGSAPLPQDSSGNGRHATFTGLPAVAYNHGSIIYNRTVDGSVHHATTGSFGSRVHRDDAGAWLDTVVTAIVWVKPVASGWGGGASAVMQLVGRWALSGEALGDPTLRLVVADPPFSNTYVVADVVEDVTTMLTVVAVPGSFRIQAYFDDLIKLNQVMPVDAPIAADVTSARVASTESADAYYQGFALLSEELDALQVGWLHSVQLAEPNEPPSIPANWAVPVLDADYDLEVPVVWGNSDDPEDDPIEYYGEYKRPGGEWQELFDWQPMTFYDWDTSQIVLGDGFQLRVKARDDYLEESDWLYSDLFNIVHAREAPTKPWIEWVWETDRHLGFLGSVFASGHGGATARASHWRYSTLEDMSDIVAEFTIYGDNYRLGHNPEDIDPSTPGTMDTLDPDTDYWADVQYEDDVGVLGERSDPVRARTAMMYAPGRHIWIRDESGNERHGKYGIINGNDGTSFLNLGVGVMGQRFPGKYLVGAPATARGFKNVVAGKGRWQSRSDDPPGVAIPHADHFALLLRAVLLSPPDKIRGMAIMGFRKQLHVPAPIVSAWGGAIVVGIQNHAFWNWRPHNYDIPLGTMPIGELVTFKICGKFIDADNRIAFQTSGVVPGMYQAGFIHDNGTTLVTVNDEPAWDSGFFNDFLTEDPPYSPLGSPQVGWIDFGFGATAPSEVGGIPNFDGIIVEAALWTHPEMSGLTNDMPWLYGKDEEDLTPEGIAASPDIQLYYRFDDPSAPTKPEFG